eukprot:Plantae.Rhodophyta-Hildenbrandia_rubra.ctg12438.p1 GENE.Plantae.Rhodophyta-Hildenbrandia_rubra.ctg12438~~Plantae.Rhodophyta-Hildenbrandia_rubra.ctg12438.p1  ORF type:complete len:769 (-),score=97.93 Plantae.Rhodophyta-Hildenbrandia_rubra.ctg12438:1610-3916(-)
MTETHAEARRGSSSSSGPPGMARALTILAVTAGIGAIKIGISRALLPPKAPTAKKIPHNVVFGEVKGEDRGERIMKGDERKILNDDYYWMRDDKRKDSKVLSYLEKENRYTRRVMRPLTGHVSKLYAELKGHLREADEGVPSPWGGWLYYSRTEEGKSYSILCRKKRDNGKEIVILNENEMAKGSAFFELKLWSPSPSQTILAYSTDIRGDERHSIRFKKLLDEKEGEALVDVIENTTGKIVWGRDNSEIYYATMDDAHRANKIWRHVIGSPAVEDVCVYAENDAVFSAFLSASSSRRFVFLGSSSSESSEIHFIDLRARIAAGKTPTVSLVSEREQNMLYDIEECGSQFYITTNADGATNFKIMRAPIDSPSRKHWSDYLPYKSSTKIHAIRCFLSEQNEPHAIVAGREGGLSQLWFVPSMDVTQMYRLQFDERSYKVSLHVNKEHKTNKVRYEFTSMTTPCQVWEYDVLSRDRKLLKETPIPNYDPSLYSTKRMEAVSADGTKIPMSMLWKTSTESTEPRPCHLYGYGSYGISVDPTFRRDVLPLVDRGVVYVIAYVRGGGEFGRSWYEAAKYKTKKKTFEDFVAVAKNLISTKVTSPDKLSIEGRSAGGLLVGSVLNMEPELFKAAVAGVPFVDVLRTMSDPSIPLTTGEWMEWGCPNQEEFFKVISEYCPYSNVGPRKYPALLVTAGLHDPRVGYWEPAKWVAKLREHTTGMGKILLKVDLNAGHFSTSDRYHYLKERAFELAFILEQLGAPREIVEVPNGAES